MAAPGHKMELHFKPSHGIPHFRSANVDKEMVRASSQCVCVCVCVLCGGFVISSQPVDCSELVILDADGALLYLPLQLLCSISAQV